MINKKTCLFFCIFLLTFNFLFSQSTQKAKTNIYSTTSLKPTSFSNEYFIYIEGVNSREAVLTLESLIQKKAGVVYFMAERYPVRCFVLRSSHEIKSTLFASWLPSSFKLLSYGTGSAGKEDAYILFKKNRKSIH